MDTQQLERMHTAPGFVAALDQSGGSTPKALRAYGIEESAYGDDKDRMFDLVHEMRTRIITSPAFTSEHILAAILFEMTMDREVEGMPTADFLWQHKGIVPFLKIDKGLEDEANGVQLMKPIPGLDALLAPLEHPETRIRVLTERAMNRALQGGCQVPIGAYALVQGEEVWLRGLVGSPDGAHVIRDEIRGPLAEGEALGHTLAQRLLAAGADVILAEVYRA